MSKETEHLLSNKANLDMHKEPLKITLKFYDKKISTQVNHSNLTLDELHQLWLEIVRGMGYAQCTIDEYY